MSGKPLEPVLMEMGCADPARSRLAEFGSLAEAWDKHTEPADLAWLAVRVAPDYRARAECIAAILLLLNQQAALPLAEGGADGNLRPTNPLLSIIPRMAQVSAAARDAGTAGVSERNQVLAVARQYVDDARVKLAAAERQRDLARPARATFAGIRAVYLLELGGWPGKAADEASALISGFTELQRESIAKQLGCVTLADAVRGMIDLKAFRSGWFAKSARPHA